MTINRTIRRLFSRATLMLVLSLLTATTAWADNVSLSVDGDIAEGTAGHYYVNMPANGTNTLTLTDASITTFKVYDDGGKSGNYSSSSGDTYLVINAPGGYYLQVTGDVIDCSTCYFNIWEGSNIEAPDRLLASGNWAQNASVSVTSGSRSIFFAFNSENAESKQGFDITVTLVDAPKHDIAIASVANGSATATIGGAVVTQAREGETVTVTATPADGYLLADVSVKDANNNDVAVTLSPWTNSATFTMPTSDVTVTPIFAASEGYEITIPATGTKRIAVPSNVTSFHVYDDGGSNGNYSPNCNGELYLYLPSGYKFHLEGSITNDATTSDYLSVYKDNGTNEVYRFRSATAGEPKAFTYDYDGYLLLKFKSNSSDDEYAGLDLTVTLIGGEHNVTVVNADNVGGSVVTANSTTAGYGQTVTLTASPAEGYVLGALSVRDADGKVVDVTDMLWYTDKNTATFTMPNSDVTVTPVFTNVMTAAGGLTVNMRKESTPKSVTIPSSVTSFKVYDYGGADCNYSDEYGGKLNLTAPEDCVLQLSGTITTQSGDGDYLNVYEDNADGDYDDLLNHVSSTADGVATTIPTVVGTERIIHIDFYSDDAVNYAGLDLTVTVISPGTDYSVTVSNADTSKGTMQASTATAQLGTTVTLTATPSDGCVLSGLSVTSGGQAVKTNWNVWTNSATFKMPNGNVTVTPTFTNDLTSLAVNLPVTGNKVATIPEGVKSVKIYDDGGPTGNYTPYCIGGVDLTAPEGCLLRFTGSVAGPEYKFFLSIAGNEIATATTNDIDVTSTNNNPRINLATSYSDTGAGLDLTATVLYAVGVATGIANGTVTINGDKTHAAADETVTLTVTPDADCTVFSVSVNGQPLVAVGGVYSFTMPAKNVTVTATFYPNVILDFAEGQTWATYYHEDGVTYSVSEGAHAYYVSSIGESTVNLTAIDGVPSGLPVLISGSGTVTLTATASAVEVTDNDARFQGTPTALSATDFTDFADRRTYVLYGGKFLLVEANSGIGAHKCWLTLSGSSASRSLKINLGETSLSPKTSLSPDPSPKGEGSSCAWYDLQGRRLNGTPAKGVYIYKGKKVIIK